MGVVAAATKLAERFDGWQNVVTGLGTIRDKLSFHKSVLRPPLSDAELEAQYTDDDLCAKIINKLPHDAVREGFTINLNAEDNDDPTSTARDIVEAAKQLDAMRKLREAWIWSRLYGAGAVFIGADDGQAVSEPLDINRVRSIKFLNVLRRTQLQVDAYYDEIDEPRFGEPKLFRLVLIGGSKITGRRELADTVIHESRLLFFRGVLTPRLPVLSGQFWDDSVLQRVNEAMTHSSSAWMSVAHLMTDASQGVLKISGLVGMLAQSGEGSLRKRFQFMDMCRSVCRAILVDAEKESFERVATSFAGVPEVLDRMMMRIAAAADMPVTILFGRSPAGMNATGESDTRAWYDTVAAERKDVLLPKLEQLVRLIMACDEGPTKGVVLDGWEIQFPPLWQQTDKEEAETFKTMCDALAGLVTAQIALPAECALKLANNGSFAELDVESRELALEVELERIANPEPPPDPNAPPPNNDPSKTDPTQQEDEPGLESLQAA